MFSDPRLAGMLLVILLAVNRAEAQFSFPRQFTDRAKQQLLEEFDMQTLGGRQFWGDVQFFHGWRIQRNVFSGNYRLLDENDWRHASGTLEVCQQKLAEIRQERSLPPMSGKGVILLHGIIRSSKSIYTVSRELRKAGFAAFPMEYPSTQVSIPEAAELLDSVISHLDGIDEVYLVGHSMGGLVIRAWFAKHQDARIKRVVMMGTPNYGAEFADLLRKNFLFRLVFGQAGQQLCTDTTGLIPTLPTPPCEFAVIAGGRGNDVGWNPFIPGDDDGTVTVRSVQLAGASDSIILPVLHHALLGNLDVCRCVENFLNTGRLRATGPAEPVKTSGEVPEGAETEAKEHAKESSS